MTREMRFGEDAGNEIIKAVRETNRRMRNAEPYRGRWFNRSGGGNCTKRYSLGVYNNPSAGSCAIDVAYNSVTETIALPYDSTPAEIKDLIDAHSEFVVDSVECETEAASDWPHGIVLVTLPGGATMFRTGDTLVRRTGGYVPEFRVDICCS